MDSSDDRDYSCLYGHLKLNNVSQNLKKKQVKVELDDSLNLIIMPGDGHCIANYFAVHFDTPLDTVLDLLDKEFGENISKYSDLSEYDNDKILLEVFRYITEKRYDSRTADIFIDAFSSISKTKVVITYVNKMKEDSHWK